MLLENPNICLLHQLFDADFLWQGVRKDMRRSTDITPAVRTNKTAINESMYSVRYFAVVMPKLVLED